MKSWEQEEAFSDSFREPSQTEIEAAQRRRLHVRAALGMIARAERQGFWKVRQIGLAWKEALDDGSGGEWVEANRHEVWKCLTQASFSGVPCAVLLVSA